MNNMPMQLYDLPGEDPAAWNILVHCASSGGLDFATLASCSHGWQGAELMRKEAMLTPVHVEVPHVVVDNIILKDVDKLHQEICSKIRYVPEDPPPYGCGNRQTPLPQEVREERIQTVGK